MFVTLTPDDPALWSAVMFIREGKYIQDAMIIALTSDRAILSSCIAIPTIVPALVSSITPDHYVFDRYLPSSYYTLDDIYVHNRYTGQWYCQRN